MLKIKKKVKVLLSGLMVNNIVVDGKMVNNMVKVNQEIKMVMKWKQNGMKVK